MMTIRKATRTDMPALGVLYDRAKLYMAEQGNAGQWAEGYPHRVLPDDLALERLYVCEDDDGIEAAFVLALGDDPTYSVIDGAWKNDAPYGTLHRIASGGRRRGMMDEIVTWAFAQTGNLRADTHEKNLPMQRALARNGFEPCGTIWTSDGSPRIAYQKTK